MHPGHVHQILLCRQRNPHQARPADVFRYPISGNQVNWDDVEAVWHHTFQQQLKVEPDEHPLLVTAPVAGRTEKDRSAHVPIHPASSTTQPLPFFHAVNLGTDYTPQLHPRHPSLRNLHGPSRVRRLTRPPLPVRIRPFNWTRHRFQPHPNNLRPHLPRLPPSSRGAYPPAGGQRDDGIPWVYSLGTEARQVGAARRKGEVLPRRARCVSRVCHGGKGLGDVAIYSAGWKSRFCWNGGVSCARAALFAVSGVAECGAAGSWRCGSELEGDAVGRHCTGKFFFFLLWMYFSDRWMPDRRKHAPPRLRGASPTGPQAVGSTRCEGGGLDCCGCQDGRLARRVDAQ